MSPNGENSSKNRLRIRRALLSVSDKKGIVELAKALESNGCELIATGKTQSVLSSSGLSVTPIERVSGSPEAFQGRMKTLSFPVCSGILYRRGDPADELDLEQLNIRPIDCVVVNFYPFEEASAREGISAQELVEKIDIGGPTLVRAAAKNAPDVLVLTSPEQYSAVIEQLNESHSVKRETVREYVQEAWERVLSYDSAIARELGKRGKRRLRYGENPHQKGFLEYDSAGPIGWGETLTSSELSYNNIADLSAAYGLASDLREIDSHATGVVIVKHGNPCGVSLVPKSVPQAQRVALTRAWEGDSVSAFGGVLVFTDPIEASVAEWLSERFVELVAAPGLSQEDSQKKGTVLHILTSKRKNMKAVPIHRFGENPVESMSVVPGGRLFQTTDLGSEESFASVTQVRWPKDKNKLSQFGIAVCRALKSNAIALVRELHAPKGAFQLVGAGQGQPNRIDALKSLAVPRAQATLRLSEGKIEECVLVSDAFFPFRDTVDAAHAAGLKFILQPGGSIKDSDSISACNEHGIAMAFTGVRHFKH
jgi:phosphoribosylaminoimidazolecarboxamide formyltransferase/IMP cyclohydrolase